MARASQQSCKSCYCSDKYNFHVPDDLWKLVVPEELRNKVVCLVCFDRFAAEKHVKYTHALHALYFAGEKARMKLRVVDSYDP
jgi:hypothetical protein